MVIYLSSVDLDNPFINPLHQWLEGMEAWCEEFNYFCEIYFGYLKFLFIFILLVFGLMSVLKSKKGTSDVWFQRYSGVIQNQSQVEQEDDMSYSDNKKINKVNLFVGFVFFLLAAGILFDYFTYFLIWSLEPLPDRLIFNFIDFSGDIDPSYLNRIMDITVSQYAHEKTIYYCIALSSFGALVNLLGGLWCLFSQKSIKVSFSLITVGLTTAILTGFTTCLPFFLS